MKRFLRLLPLLALSCSTLYAGTFEADSLKTIPHGFGVNIHFTQPKAGELEMIRAAGFRWVRADVSWHRIEKKPQQYDFAEWDGLLQALEAHHLKAVFILDYSNPLYETTQSISTEGARDAFARWAAATVEHFRGHGLLWEIWNEANNKAYWQPQPNNDDYESLVKATVKSIRRTTPHEAIVGPASSEIDLPFLEHHFRAGLLEAYDAITVHPYRQQGPETVIPEYQALRDLLARFGAAEKPVLSGEWGYSTAWKRFDEAKQAKMLARQWLINLASNVNLSIWYDWRDDGQIKDVGEMNFGVVHHAYRAGGTPVYEIKPAYTAAQCLTRVLEGYHFEKRLPTDRADVFILQFRAGASTRLAAWTTSETSVSTKIPLETNAPIRQSRVQVISLLGDSTLLPTADPGTLEISLTDSPQYLVPKS